MDNETALKKVVCKVVMESPFFGTLLLQLPKKFSNTLNTAGVNGKDLAINPEYFANLQENEKIGLIIHEVMHLALDHLNRRKNRVHSVWNIACDYAINNIIEELNESSIKLPPNGYVNREWKDKNADEIYSILIKDDEGGMGGSGGMEEQPWGDHDEWDQVDDEISKEWKHKLSQAITVARTAGKTPGGLEKLISEILTPKLDWKKELLTYVCHQELDYTYTPPDLRADGLYDDILIPDINGEGIQEIIIAIDTSGSTYNFIDQFIAEVNEIIESVDIQRTHYVQIDADIQQWDTFEGKGMPDITIKGFGGTDFRPLWDEIQKRNISPAVIVFLTDGYGPFPDNSPYPTLWVYTEHGASEPPFGRLTYLNP